MFEDLFVQIDTLLAAYVTNSVQAIVRFLSPSVILFAILYVVLWGIALLRGVIDEPIRDMVGRLLRIVLPAAVGLSVAYYSTFLSSWLTNAPGELLAAIAVGGTSSIPGRSTNQIGVILDNVLIKGMDAATLFMNEFDLWSGNISIGVIGFCLFLLIIAVTTYAAFLILIGKVVLAVLLALGPAAVILLMFAGTQKFFEAWLGQAINSGLLIVLAGSSVNLMSGLMESTAESVAAAAEPTVGLAVPLVVLDVGVILVLLQIWGVASALAGGVQMSTLGAGRAVWSRLTGGSGRLGRNVTPSGIRANVRAMQREVRDASWIASGVGSAFGYPGKAAGSTSRAGRTSQAGPSPAGGDPAASWATHRPLLTLQPLKRTAEDEPPPR